MTESIIFDKFATPDTYTIAATATKWKNYWRYSQMNRFLFFKSIVYQAIGEAFLSDEFT